MKIQLLSDTHTFDYDVSTEADVIVHAGDFSNNLNGCLEFVEYCKYIKKECVFVLGNHDYFGSVLNEVIPFLKSQHLNVLTWDNSVVINGYTFVGGTLFTNFRMNKDVHLAEQSMFLAKHNIYDFISVRSNVNTFIQPEEYVTMFNQTYNNIQKYRNQDKVVVVTHFPPHLACLDPQYADSPLNPYFINDLDVSGFKTWLSGHTHTAVDKVVDGCRLVINPYGYPYEHGKNGFRDELLIEV